MRSSNRRTTAAFVIAGVRCGFALRTQRLIAEAFIIGVQRDFRKLGFS
jgi:hypothetical protein